MILLKESSVFSWKGIFHKHSFCNVPFLSSPLSLVWNTSLSMSGNDGTSPALENGEAKDFCVSSPPCEQKCGCLIEAIQGNKVNFDNSSNGGGESLSSQVTSLMRTSSTWKLMNCSKNESDIQCSSDVGYEADISDL